MGKWEISIGGWEGVRVGRVAEAERIGRERVGEDGLEVVGADD